MSSLVIILLFGRLSRGMSDIKGGEGGGGWSDSPI
jgi:hypothetical protein